MKKLFSFIMVFCMTLLTGVVLSGCGDEFTHSISVEVAEDSQSFVNITLKSGNYTLQKNNLGNYNVEKGSNIKVEITANATGIDMTDFVVKVGQIEKIIIKNDKYSPLRDSTNLNYGYFLISNVNSDMTLYFSGAKEISSSFNFEVVGLQDEEVVEKLKMTSISVEQYTNPEGGAPVREYENLYTYLTAETPPTFERRFDADESLANTYTTFRLRFAGTNPFNITSTEFVKIKDKNGNTFNIKQIALVDNSYVVDMGNLGSYDRYTIVLDFAKLNYKEYLVSVPDDNMTYQVRVDKNVLDYRSEAIVTVTKLLDETLADYTNMVVMVNSLTLEMIEDSEIGNTVQYKIPSKITPNGTGGSSVFKISVSGIEYLVQSYSVYANVSNAEEIIGSSQLINPYLWLLDDDGNKIGINGVGAGGQHISLEGQRNMIVWEYDYNELKGAYYSAYDLYDYDVYLNSDVKILNVKEVLGEATADLSVEVYDGYTFKAYYNEETETFDRFQLEFICDGDMTFDFRNFVVFNKTIDISYSFEDDRVEEIQYMVIPSNSQNSSTWVSIAKDESVRVSVKAGDIIAYKVVSYRDTVGEHEFKIADSTVCNAWMAADSYQEGDYTYTILKYIVSDAQFEGVLPFKLVPAGTI